MPWLARPKAEGHWYPPADFVDDARRLASVDGAQRRRRHYTKQDKPVRGTTGKFRNGVILGHMRLGEQEANLDFREFACSREYLIAQAQRAVPSREFGAQIFRGEETPGLAPVDRTIVFAVSIRLTG